MSTVQAMRAAAVLTWVSGIGLGLPCLFAIRELSAGRGIPFVLGYPAYGGGPFERHGINTTVPLVAGFLLICVVECVAAWLLWNGHRVGAILSMSLLPLGAIYWWGFALPYPPIMAVVRTVLILMAWRTSA